MEKMYDLITSLLPRHPDETKHGIWVNDNDEIMCKKEKDAEAIADFFEELGYDVMHTHYYDDKETDGLNFGWYCVYVDGM